MYNSFLWKDITFTTISIPILMYTKQGYTTKMPFFMVTGFMPTGLASFHSHDLIAVK
jgi:hypothetical protein